MRRYIKKQLYELQGTLSKALASVQTLLQRRRYGDAYSLLTQLQQALIEAGGVIEREENIHPEDDKQTKSSKENGGEFPNDREEDIEAGKGGREAVRILENICEVLYEIAKDMEGKTALPYVRQAKNQLSAYFDCLRDIPEDKLKVVFFPYKASMWTSFESIWEAAKGDKECDIKVVPIPYCDFGEGETDAKWNYEIDKYPPYVPVIPFDRYSLQKERPDIAFIHNPYDDTNTLTSVHPEYYSENIKKHAALLVYSPYFIMGGFKRGKTDGLIVTKGGINADRILVQSEFVKGIYESYGYEPEKLLAYGSPKADAVVKSGQSRQMPEKWRGKLEGKKKIILLNTHWSYFIRGKAWEKQGGGKKDFAVRYHRELIEALDGRKGEVGLIWRPHPLMYKAMERRMPEDMEYVRELTRHIQESDYGVIDEEGDYLKAFGCSDALITTYSSLINEYLITGKPVMIFQTKPTDEGGERSPVDYRKCYFRFSKQGNMVFEKFLDLVLAGEDPQYGERMETLKNKSFSNLEGTAGAQIYDCLRQIFKEGDT